MAWCRRFRHLRVMGPMADQTWGKSDLCLSISCGRSSMLTSSFRAFPVTRISSSSFNCNAEVSRVCVDWIRKIIRKVITVVAVLHINCQVSDQWKKGPLTSHNRTPIVAIRNVMGLPAQCSTFRENVSNHLVNDANHSATLLFNRHGGTVGLSL